MGEKRQTLPAMDVCFFPQATAACYTVPMSLFKISVVILHFYMNHNNANVWMEMRFLVYLD